MSDFGNDFVVLSDEEGNEYEFEHLDTLEYNNETYMAFVPAETSLESEEDLVIMKLINEGTDDEMLMSVVDDEELEPVFGQFLERIQNAYFDDEYDEMEDEEDDEDEDE